MNVNQIFNMISRMVMRKLLHRGVDAGINRVAGSGRKKADMTDEEHRQHQKSKQMSKRGKQASKVLRRLGR